GKLGGGTGVKRGGRGELESAVEARVGVVVVGHLAEARAEFHGLRFEDDLGVVLKLVVVGGLADVPAELPPPVKAPGTITVESMLWGVWVNGSWRNWKRVSLTILVPKTCVSLICRVCSWFSES